jgi:hypothetical protein
MLPEMKITQDSPDQYYWFIFSYNRQYYSATVRPNGVGLPVRLLWMWLKFTAMQINGMVFQ